MFSPRNPETACGIWSLTYAISFLIVFSLIIISLIFSRKMSHKNVRKMILIAFIFAFTTEIIKMIFTGLTYGIKEVEFVPLYFCSLFIYMTILSISKKEFLKKAGLSFLFFGGIIGALAFFIFPNACIPNYPIYHFMCIRTLLYHGLMIYVGVLIVITGYYKPSINDFKYYVISLLIICLLAYFFNISFGYDFMYLMNPLPFKLSQMVYDFNSNIYPFIIMILEIIVPFFITYIIYELVIIVFKKRASK